MCSTNTKRQDSVSFQSAACPVFWQAYARALPAAWGLALHFLWSDQSCTAVLPSLIFPRKFPLTSPPLRARNYFDIPRSKIRELGGHLRILALLSNCHIWVLSFFYWLGFLFFYHAFVFFQSYEHTLSHYKSPLLAIHLYSWHTCSWNSWGWNVLLRGTAAQTHLGIKPATSP